MKSFLEEVEHRVILADGAMGTEFYERGVFINRCYDELNITNPDLVKKVHLEYIDAESELIETNTFAANRFRLAQYGLEDKTRELNLAAARIAKSVAKGRAFVAGAIGPLGVSLEPIGRHSKDEAGDIFREQIVALVESEVDVLIFETFSDLAELEIAVSEAKKISKIPVIASVSLKQSRDGRFVGVTPAAAILAIEKTGADIGGTNCSSGPQGVLEAIVEMRKVSGMKLAAMPNAGMPQTVNGRTIYMATPEYMGEYAKRLATAGASVIGGCCGTRPADIREMAKFIKSVSPSNRSKITLVKEPNKGRQILPPAPLKEKSEFGAKLGNKFVVSVELDPPMGLSPEEAIISAEFLYEHGVDAVNIADGPRAMARMSPIALGSLVKQRSKIEPIVHYCCRDRNILGMQMDLLGANALGLHNILIITGDPPKMGSYPNATAVFDIDSIGLIHMVNSMNHGSDASGRGLNGVTKFVVGCGVNLGAVDIDLEAERFAKKVAAGAEFVFSQPVYDTKKLEVFLKKIAHVKKIPFFAGILPLASLKNAEFLHNEVPGMQIPDEVLQKMRSAKTKDAQQKLGMAIAKDALEAAKSNDLIGGAYIFPPFGNYRAVAELLS